MSEPQEETEALEASASAPDAVEQGEGRPPGQLGKRLAFGVFLGLAVYAGMVLFGDAEETLGALREFPLWRVPVAILLSFSNYVVRFPRWERYCRIIGVRMTRGTSFLVYLSGLALTVSPGKMGEIFKSWLIRRVDGTQVSRTAPIVLAERFTDLMGFLLLMAIGGLFVKTEYAWVFWGTLVGSCLLLALVASTGMQRFTIGLLSRSPLPERLTGAVETVFVSTRQLLCPRELPLAIFLAALGWGAEGLGLWFLAGAFPGAAPSLAFCTTAFALAAVAGAVLIVFPGGLGITEGLLSTLLAGRYTQVFGIASGIARARAMSVVLLFRLSTLWFAVALGFVALGLFEWRAGRNGLKPAADV